jgi:hypothetical protein
VHPKRGDALTDYTALHQTRQCWPEQSEKSVEFLPAGMLGAKLLGAAVCHLSLRAKNRGTSVQNLDGEGMFRT